MRTNVPLFADHCCKVTGLLRLSLGNSHHLPDQSVSLVSCPFSLFKFLLYFEKRTHQDGHICYHLKRSTHTQKTKQNLDILLTINRKSLFSTILSPPPSSQDEALSRYSASGEVPRQELEVERALGTLDATHKVPRNPGLPREEH